MRKYFSISNPKQAKGNSSYSVIKRKVEYLDHITPNTRYQTTYDNLRTNIRIYASSPDRIQNRFSEKQQKSCYVMLLTANFLEKEKYQNTVNKYRNKRLLNL